MYNYIAAGITAYAGTYLFNRLLLADYSNWNNQDLAKYSSGLKKIACIATGFDGARKDEMRRRKRFPESYTEAPLEETQSLAKL